MPAVGAQVDIAGCWKWGNVEEIEDSVESVVEGTCSSYEPCLAVVAFHEAIVECFSVNDGGLVVGGSAAGADIKSVFSEGGVEPFTESCHVSAP